MTIFVLEEHNLKKKKKKNGLIKLRGVMTPYRCPHKGYLRVATWGKNSKCNFHSSVSLRCRLQRGAQSLHPRTDVTRPCFACERISICSLLIKLIKHSYSSIPLLPLNLFVSLQPVHNFILWTRFKITIAENWEKRGFPEYWSF